MNETISSIKHFYQLTKPGIVYGNLWTAAAGFAFASQGIIQVFEFLAMIVGLACIIGSACAFNNVLDRSIDAVMKRTQKRVLVTTSISPRDAVIFAGFLLVLGSVVLVYFTNIITAGVALFGHIAYVVIYGIAKRKTVWGTVIGSISGAVPPVVGYVAAANMIDLAAGLLFVTLVVWQMPHFYALAIFGKDDYKAARIPVLPVVSGIRITKLQITVYIGGFLIITGLFTLLGYTGWIYFISMMGISLWWFVVGIKGFSRHDDVAWARSIFKISLIALLAFSIILSLDAMAGLY